MNIRAKIGAVCLAAVFAAVPWTGLKASAADYFGSNGGWKIIGDSDTAGVTNNNCTWVTGKVGKGVNFSGTRAWLQLPSGLLDSAKGFTFSAWVYWRGSESSGSNQFWQRVFDFGTGGNSTDSHDFYMTPLGSCNYTMPSKSSKYAIDGTGFVMYYYSGSTITKDDFVCKNPASTTPLPDKKWTYVTCTLDGTTAKYYINGSLYASLATDLTPAMVKATNLYIGRSNISGDPFFNGIIDEAYVYNRALSAGEIQSLMGSTTAAAATGTGTTAAGGTTTAAAGQSSGTTAAAGGTAAGSGTAASASAAAANQTASAVSGAAAAAALESPNASNPSLQKTSTRLVSNVSHKNEIVILWIIAGALIVAGAAAIVIIQLRARQIL